MATEFIEGVRNYLDHAERSEYSRLEIQHGLTAILMYVGTRPSPKSTAKPVVTPTFVPDEPLGNSGQILSDAEGDSDADAEGDSDTESEIEHDTAGNRLMKGVEALEMTNIAWGTSTDVFDLVRGTDHEFRPVVPETNQTVPASSVSP